MIKANKQVKVLTFGTFDLLHKGHVSYLEQAKKFGDKLYVLVACDQAVLWAKKRLPSEGEAVRLAKIKKLKFVDVAWIGEPVNKVHDYLRPIIKVRPDVICLGYDQALREEEWLRGELKKMRPEPILVRLEPFEEHIYKTSLLGGSSKKKGRP